VGLLQNLSVLALRQLLQGACQAVAFQGAEAAIGLLTDHFIDHSQRLTRALQTANERAWRALEFALAGESIWTFLDRTEDKALRQQVRAFLDAASLSGGPVGNAEFRQQCLRELRAARKAGALTRGTLDVRELARQVGALARFGDPPALLDAEWQAVAQMAEEVRRASYPALGQLLGVRPPDGVPVVVAAARYFFRRAVEADRELFQGLAFARMEQLGRDQDSGFAALADALDRQDLRLGEVLDVAAKTDRTVSDIHEEQRRQGEQNRAMYEAVIGLEQQFNLMRRELRPRDSLSIHTEAERQLLKRVVDQYRALPEGQRQAMPALLLSLSKLEVVVGDFDAAQRDSQTVAGLVADLATKAEAHYTAYQAALGRADWDTALREMNQAAERDPARFKPFPTDRYVPERILGAGGFGVAFLCRHKHMNLPVVVKALHTDALDRGPDTVFVEATHLKQLKHPGIIAVSECGYVDEAGQTGPYLVMDYFEGLTLEEHVRRHGPLAPEDLLAVAGSVAEALRAAHDQKILHRDIKATNLLVRRDPQGWHVKLIDFGLALKHSLLGNASARSQMARSAGPLVYSITGTLDYAAPEQTGRLPGVQVGPYSDVYGFGKTCCYALFQTTEPLPSHWRRVPEALAELLEHCLMRAPEQRLASFAAVLQRLRSIPPKAPPPPPAPARPEPPRPAAVSPPSVPAPQPAAVPPRPPALPAKTPPQPPPAPAVAATPPTSGARRIEIPIQGEWSARPVDKPDAPWKRVSRLPGTVMVSPREAYWLDLGAGRRDLSRLVSVPRPCAA
jgi:serine/threonine protein kinase